MTNVLIITYRFIFGGIEKLLLDVFEHNEDPDIRFDLLTLSSEKDEELIDRIHHRGIGYYSLDLDKHGKVERQFYHYKMLYCFLKAHHYDVVHINITSYARVLDMAVVKAAGVRKRIIHSHSADENDAFLRKLVRPMRKLYDYTATDFLACSDEAARHLFSKNVCKNKRYQIINNGINTADYCFSMKDRKCMRDSLGLGNDELLIGHIGRFTEAKNHLFLLDVFSEILKRCSSAWLLLVGDGEKREDIKSRIDMLGIQDRVILYGSSSNISPLLSAMDVFLFPSRWEGLGISVIEAQSNGLPCYISENIPKAAVLTSNVFRLNISDGPDCWAERVLTQKTERVEETDRIIRAGYDIQDSVSRLEQIYKA